MFIQKKEIPNLVRNLCLKGARPITTVLKSEKKLLKKDRITGEPNTFSPSVTKVSKINGILNFDYQHSVNLQRDREGKIADFTTGSTWYEHVHSDPKPIVRHKDDHSLIYLQLKLEKELQATYIFNGKVVPKGTIKNLFPKKPENAQTRQRTDKMIRPIAVKLDNILSIVCDGKVWTVKG